MKKTKGKQNYLIHKIKEKKINYGIVIGVKTLDGEETLYIDTGGLNYDWAIEALEGYIDIIKAEREEQRQNTTVALPFAITREALEDNLFQEPIRLADMPNTPPIRGRTAGVLIVDDVTDPVDTEADRTWFMSRGL